MKKMFLLLTIISLIFTGCASTEKVENPSADIEKVFEIDLEKNQIYDLSLQFIAENFKSAKAVLEYQDREAGRIIGNGSTTITTNDLTFGYHSYPADFTMIIDARDNRYRVTFRNLQWTLADGAIRPVEYKVPYDILLRELDNILVRLHSYLLNRNNDDF